MYLSVPLKKRSGSARSMAMLLIVSFFLLSNVKAQSNFIPELVFQNPSLISGTAGQDGAVYRFYNVASGLNAEVTIKGRSSSAVVLSNIDVSDAGWSKAFQPQLGIPGTAPANANWWMEFEMRFFDANNGNKKKVKGFKVTAIDIDGDGGTLGEYLQMAKVTTTTLGTGNLLTTKTAVPMLTDFDQSSDNKKGTDKFLQGPVTNFTNIDTGGTNVMATFEYQDKDLIAFRYGATTGASTTTAGERLNSLWFKAFDLTILKLLPTTFHNFTARLDKKNVTLDWTVDTDDMFGDYRVERSTDGKNYQEIGVVLTNPNIDATNSYSFKDYNVSSTNGIVYYRLHWLLRSKEQAYSRVLVVKLNKDPNSGSLVVYPNPAQDQVWATLPSSWQGKEVTIEVVNATGTKVQSVAVRSAGQTENIRINNLPKGLYLVQANCNGISSTQRIIKD